jgi:predicted GTPase
VTKPESVQHLNDWVNNFREYAGQDVPVSIIVNKTDLAAQNKEAIKSIKSSLDKLGLPIYMTSAKTGDNVEKAFSDMAFEIAKHGRVVTEADEPSAHTNGVPEQFDSPQVLLDYVMMRFCDALGDQELGMHIVRKQISNLNIEFQAITANQARVLAANLVPVIAEFKGEEQANHLKHELKKACDRCNG